MSETVKISSMCDAVSMFMFSLNKYIYLNKSLQFLLAMSGKVVCIDCTLLVRGPVLLVAGVGSFLCDEFSSWKSAQLIMNYEPS